mmetsp:Transcript_6793/g.9888  ORF Transcript_6793/g.9888 Transcript_6793/m.9888 type:complete len:177 (-) Transcript_6793:122-652(-)
MTVHSLYIFDRRGKTLFTKNYSAAARQAPTNVDDEEEYLAEKRKLIFGMLFSLRELTGSLGPEGQLPAVYSVRTGAATLHNYETRSGLRFAMYTNNDIQQTTGKGDGKFTSVREALQHIYSEIWVEFVVRSPLYRPGELAASSQSQKGIGKFDIRSTNFEQKLDAYLSSMPWFDSK